MTPRYLGERVLRNEDARLLTGRALFVDDVQLPGILHVAFVRSPHAHARLVGIDASRALEREGVIAVYTAEDLGDYWQHGPLLVPPPPVEGMAFHQRTQVPLAKDKVRHPGEAVALVVAVSRYVAEDAVEDVVVDYEPLPAVVDLEKALEPGSAFPASDPVFVLVAEQPGSKTAVIGVAGGAYAGGAKTTRLKVGKPLTLVNTTTGAAPITMAIGIGALRSRYLSQCRKPPAPVASRATMRTASRSAALSAAR